MTKYPLKEKKMIFERCSPLRMASCLANKRTGVAQLVEHRSPKPRVVSSSLTARAKTKIVHEKS